MTTVAVKSGIVKKIFSFILTPLLSLFLSKHTKRLFYFASLYGIMFPIEQLKCDVVEKLNQAMGLARDSQALMLPASFSRVVWGGTNVSDILEAAEDNNKTFDDSDVKMWSTLLVRKTSSWLRFGSQDEMQRETERFIRCIPQLVSH